MHPLLVLVPVAALILGPRLWVKQVLKKNNRVETKGFPTGGEFAKELLERHHLHAVKVEGSDLGDHYDPQGKAVRLTRDKIERRTLTAITTAAHEVAHALQDASGYGPFVWRMRLVSLAQITGQVGAVILIAVPAVSLLARQPLPPLVIGAAAVAMMGTGMAAQLAALPTELDASFSRALPLLKDGHLSQDQAQEAKKILLASSLTYAAASLLSVLNIWPWLGWRGPVRFPRNDTLMLFSHKAELPAQEPTAGLVGTTGFRRGKRTHARQEPGLLQALTRQIAKPLLKGYFRLLNYQPHPPGPPPNKRFARNPMAAAPRGAELNRLAALRSTTITARILEAKHG